MRLAIPADIVQLYFPESEIVYDYSTESWVLETMDGYTIPTIELKQSSKDYVEPYLWVDAVDWPEVT